MPSSSVVSPPAIEPVALGPSWRKKAKKWDLPELSLGYQIAGVWVPSNLQDPDGSPFQLTPEQTRLLVWWYAIDERGRFAYRDGVVQRIKGWGKDPFASVISAVEFVGPCRFARFSDDEPVAVENPAAWVQVAATSKDQTRNTMTLFPSLFTKKCIEEHQIDIGKEIIYAHKGARRIEAVTSSPRALEGGRPTFTVANETQHWVDSNEGHAMWAVIQRNAMKAPEGTSRVLAITNAFNPSEDSVAQRTREAWEKIQAGEFVDSGIMYDSLEAPPDAPLTAEAAPKVIEAVRGDSWWVDPEAYARFVIDSRTPPSESRRFAYNQITAAEDAWIQPAHLIEFAHHDLEVSRADEWALFFDGSKSDDSTGLMGCRLSDGHLVTLGIWEKPTGARGQTWIVDRFDVDQRVREILQREKVAAFWADPSHAKDDEGFGYWDAVIDGWHRDFGDAFQMWAVQSGPNRHSVMWDMSWPQNHKLFTQAAEHFVTEIEEQAKPDQPLTLTHDGHPMLVAHMRNARQFPNKFGRSLMKEHRESKRKIDLAVCAVGARMLRRIILNRPGKGEPGKWMNPAAQPCLCGCGELTETGFKTKACKARFEERDDGA